ncbi:hypothetical protein HPB47_016532 [Ixodes persulcatus]|uniref:Uncharacterized protein n=1 Tax=Ixodes persulcatus TaxID=34615 RepID=A0AC60QQM8_IXOPE|nr:hypothetical protein HPB47_016532 [Ixodes persulcatus]
MGSFQGMVASGEHIARDQKTVSVTVRAVPIAIVRHLGVQRGWIHFPETPTESLEQERLADGGRFLLGMLTYSLHVPCVNKILHFERIQVGELCCIDTLIDWNRQCRPTATKLTKTCSEFYRTTTGSSNRAPTTCQRLSPSPAPFPRACPSAPLEHFRPGSPERPPSNPPPPHPPPHFRPFEDYDFRPQQTPSPPLPGPLPPTADRLRRSPSSSPLRPPIRLPLESWTPEDSSPSRCPLTPDTFFYPIDNAAYNPYAAYQPQVARHQHVFSVNDPPTKRDLAKAFLYVQQVGPTFPAHRAQAEGGDFKPARNSPSWLGVSSFPRPIGMSLSSRMHHTEDVLRLRRRRTSISSQPQPASPFQSAREALDTLGIEASVRTARRRFAEPGMSSRTAALKPLLSESSIQDRLRLARVHEDRSRNDWGRVVFSDKSTFTTHYNPQFVKEVAASGRIAMNI